MLLGIQKMYRVLAVHHTNIASMINYLTICQSHVSITYPDLTFEIGDQTHPDYLYYMNGDRYPVFIMYKDGTPYARLLGKVTLDELTGWIQKTFD